MVAHRARRGNALHYGTESESWTRCSTVATQMSDDSPCQGNASWSAEPLTGTVSECCDVRLQLSIHRDDSRRQSPWRVKHRARRSERVASRLVSPVGGSAFSSPLVGYLDHSAVQRRASPSRGTCRKSSVDTARARQTHQPTLTLGTGVDRLLLSRGRMANPSTDMSTSSLGAYRIVSPNSRGSSRKSPALRPGY